MIVNNLDRFIAIGKELIVYSKTNLNINCDLKIRYRIDSENKEIRLYDVPSILTMKEKCIIYYAILDKYYFYPLNILNNNSNTKNIEEFVVKENGYTYHEFNEIEGESKGILGELLFEIPRQEIETEKLSKIRDVYEMLTRNTDEIGKQPIYISFSGLKGDFNDLFKVIEYIFKYDDNLKTKKEKCRLIKKAGFLGINKAILIIPNKNIGKEA